MTIAGIAEDGLTPMLSPSESARFGRPIARLTIEPGIDVDVATLMHVADTCDADVIILRYPSGWVDLYHHLMRLKRHEPLFADCLFYWECDLTRHKHQASPSGGLRAKKVAATGVAKLVRTVFERYGSHYAANPLFDPADALEGYVEWVTNLVDSGDATCLVITDADADDESVGFAVVDFSTNPPDIRLAGISPRFRRRGHYRDLIASTMDLAANSGNDRLAISTQAHNYTVMATWAALGWTPVKTVTTVHLVKRGLI